MWKQDQARRHSDPCLPEEMDLLSLNIHPRYLFKQGAGGGVGGEQGGGGGGGGGGITFPGIAQKGAGRESWEGKRRRKEEGGGGGGGGGRGKKESKVVTEKLKRMRSLSHDSRTQTGQQSVADLYRSIAGESVLKMSEQKLREGAVESQRQRHYSHKKSSSREKINTLPPIHLGHDKQQQRRPRSKSASIAPPREHRVTGERREEEGRRRDRRGSDLQYTSHWKD